MPACDAPLLVPICKPITFLPSFSWLSEKSRLFSWDFLGREKGSRWSLGHRGLRFPWRQPLPLEVEGGKHRRYQPAEPPYREQEALGHIHRHLLHEPRGVPLVMPIVLGHSQVAHGHDGPLDGCHVLGWREKQSWAED